MSKAIWIKKEEVTILNKMAHCTKCNNGTVFFEEENEEFGTGFYSKENEKLIGEKCEVCGTTYIEEVYETYYTTGGYALVECACGEKLHIYKDGQQCRKCERMYESLGSEIMYRGY